MAKRKVIITRKPPGPALGKLLQHCDAWMWEEDRPIPRDLLLDKIREAEGLFTMIPDQINAELIQAAPRLKVVSTMAVGVDNIDTVACTRRGIPVGYTPGVVTEATADLAFSLILMLSRRLFEAAQFVRRGEWKAWSPTLMIANDVFGKTLGIFGLGRIGQAVARRAHGFNMRILYHDVAPNHAAEKALGAAFRTFDQLLAEADIVAIHAPLMAETRQIFNAAAFAKMKPSAFLINAARGGLVNQRDLYQALSKGAIKGAALDVTDPEPIAPDDPLLKLPNCIIVPHVGTSTWETRAVMTEIAVDNLLNALEGKPMVSCFNAEALKR